MPDLRVVQFSKPETFLDAVRPYDDSFMNFPVGSLLDSLDPANPRTKDRTVQYRTLLAVYKGDDLIVTLTKVADDFAWMIATPRGLEEQLSSEEVTRSSSLLSATLSTIVDPTKVDSVIGPERLVNAFIETWVDFMGNRGLRLKALDPFFKSQVSFATLATLPPPSPTLPPYKICLAQVEEDADVVAPFVVDFTRHGPKQTTLEEAKRVMQAAVQMKQLWLCRSPEGEIVAYSLVGRVTPRTIAIRNVYVSPSHRRKGIAECMVKALTRLYLGAEPLGFEGAPSAKPALGTREEICLNVSEDYVAQLYKRCGFLLGEDDHEPMTGKKGWFQSSWRGVEIL